MEVKTDIVIVGTGAAGAVYCSYICRKTEGF